MSDPRAVLGETTDESDSPVTAANSADPRGRSDRGQLILIAAILLAVLVVSSVLLLNTAQSATELRTNQQSQSVTDAAQTNQEIQHGLETLFETSTSLAEADAKLPYSLDLESDVEAFHDRYLGIKSANTAGMTTISYDEQDTVTGGIVFQTERGTFEAADGDDTWRVLTDVNSVPTLSADIERVSPSSSFNISVSGISAQLRVENTGSGYTVTRLDGGTVARTCSGLEPPIVVDFHRGSGEVRGATDGCEQFTLGRGLSSGYSIEFENGHNAEGTYVISGSGDATFDDAADVNSYDPNVDWPTSDEPNYRGPADASSNGDDIVVNPTFVVTYDDPDLTYQSAYGLYNRTGR
ncbi:hypothetical protein [Halovenus marina]|uniref:hypothetical protein n=1 Tax=Halovenus marina TaxID=3396621 RepID=UPI003F570C31